MTGLLGTGPVALLALAVLGLVALLVAVRLVLAPTAAAAVLMVVVVSNVSGIVGQVGPASVYLAALGVATLSLVLGVLRGQLVLRWSPLFGLFGVFLAVRAASVVFAASDVAAGTAEITDEAKGLVLLVVLTLLLAGAAQPHRLTAAAVTVVVVLAALTAVQEFVLGDSSDLGGLTGIGVASEVAGLGARHSGTQGDPNFWCRVLVLFLPLALALMWSRSERVARAHRTADVLRYRWAVAALLLMLGAYLSQSRGGMIAMFVSAVLTLLLLVRDRGRLLAGTAAVVLGLSLLPGVGSRLATLGELSSASSSSTVVDPSLEGREAAQKAGLAMFEDSPLIGVGAGNFQVAGDRYQRQLGISVSEKGNLLAPHDIYVQQLAEGGVVGLAGYLVFYLGSLGLMLSTRRRWRALARLGRAGETEQRLSAAVAAGLVGWGLASAFLHLATLPILLVLLAIGASLHLRARQAEAETGLGDLLAMPESRRPSRRNPEDAPSRVARTTLVLLGAALAAGGGVVLQTAVHATPGYAASVRLEITPEAGSGGAGSATSGSEVSGYSYSVLDRARTVPTILTLATEFARPAAEDVGLTPAEQRAARVTVDRDGNGTSFRIIATTAHQDRAAPLAQAVADRLGRYLSTQRSLYGVRPLTSTPASQVGADRSVRVALAVLLWLAALAVLGAATRPAEAPRPPDDEDEFAEPDPPVVLARS